MDEKQAEELLAFLSLRTRPDLKGQATEYILGLTGNVEGRRYLTGHLDILQALLALTSDLSLAIVKDSYHSLINLSADPAAHEPLIEEVKLLPVLLRRLLDPDFDFADQICTLLSNLSREERTSRRVFQAMQDEGVGLAKVVEVFCAKEHNPKASLHYLGPFLSNLTQLPEARAFILDRERCVLQRLLPYTQYEASTVRRGGVIAILKNCCFEYSCHEWLLSDAVDLLPFLLLPLAGPEEFSEEEMERLPPDLQYLPEDKKREKDPDIRKMLIEAIMMLTSTKEGRHKVKEKGAYLIMREFHKWETEPDVLAACEKLIQVLIGDEPDPGMDNLNEVQIPEDVEEKLQCLDKDEERMIKEEQLQGRQGPSTGEPEEESYSIQVSQATAQGLERAPEEDQPCGKFPDQEYLSVVLGGESRWSGFRGRVLTLLVHAHSSSHVEPDGVLNIQIKGRLKLPQTYSDAIDKEEEEESRWEDDNSGLDAGDVPRLFEARED